MIPPATPGGVDRREMLGRLARWTIPTVATMTLGARVLEAKASCPPCQKKVAGVCKACTISQMLNCQCEPCLGPPYCAAVGPVAPITPGLSAAPAPGSQQLGGQPGGQGGSTNPYVQLQRDRARALRDPFRQQLYEDPFQAKRGTPNGTGLYERLRPDTSTVRRRP